MKSSSQDIFDNITFIRTCPLCKTAYDKQGIRRVMGEGNTQWLHLTCAGCQSALMAVVITGGSGVSSVGMMTDFNYDDAIRFCDEPLITTDDCLALHQFLNDLHSPLTLSWACARSAREAPLSPNGRVKKDV